MSNIEKKFNRFCLKRAKKDMDLCWGSRKCAVYLNEKEKKKSSSGMSMVHDLSQSCKNVVLYSDFVFLTENE